MKFGTHPHSPLARGVAAWAIVFLLFVICQFPYRHLPYFWDAMGYVFPHAEEIYEENLFPILRNWDTGHPTGFTWALAAVMKIAGKGPLAGHLLTWAFAALLVVAFYGNCRMLKVPRWTSIAGAGAFLTFPMVWASTLQMELDLPLAAMILAAFWFWGRDRTWGYVLAGSYASLIKIYGIIFIVPLTITLFLTSGRFWQSRTALAAFGRRLLWTLSPAAIFGLFLAIRYLVRGPGMTLNWTTGNQPIPFWHFEDWKNFAPKAWNLLFVENLLQWALIAIAGLWLAVVNVTVARDRRILIRTAELRMPVAYLSGIAAVGFLFLQLQSLVPRYALSVAAMTFPLLTLGLWRLARRQWAAIAVHALLALLFWALWRPEHAELLPDPLNRWLKRPPRDEAWCMESDLRFIDFIHAIQWTGQTILADADATGRPKSAAAQWPICLALRYPPYGYVEQPLTTEETASWEEVDWNATAYAIQIYPLILITDPPEEARPRLVAENQWGEATARVWSRQKQ